VTLFTPLVCPWRLASSLPVAASQRLIVLFMELLARLLPSWLKATVLIKI